MHLFNTKKRWAAGLAVCATLGGAAAASANSTVYYDGLTDGAIGLGVTKGSPFGNLTESDGLSYYGATICMAASPDGGQVQCTNDSTGVGKPYNGSYRSATCRPADGHTVTGKCRAVYQ